MAQGTNILAYATLAISTSAVSLAVDANPVLPAKCKRVFITAETQPVRWRADGTAPTSTEGHLLAIGDSISFTNFNYRQLLESIKFIATVTGDGAIKITYFD